MRRRAAWPSLPLLCAAGAAAAHDGSGAAGATPWLEILVIASLVASAAAYALGVARLWRHAGLARGIGGAAVASFAAGWLALASALASPLDAWGARSFAAHMVQHELLMVVAAPLLVLGRPLAAFAWALPVPWRSPIGRLFARPAWAAAWRRLVHPLTAFGLHALALWAWHVPAAFEAALHGEGWHVLQHATFLSSALLFWWTVFGPRRGSGPALASLFATMVHSGALGALFTFAPHPRYASYAALGAAQALVDQQLGGLIMWVPAGAVYVLAALGVAARTIGLRSLRGAQPLPAAKPA